jgi:hypothetical protein
MRLWGLVLGIGISFTQSWQDVGGGTNFPVHALLSWGGYLYVGGRFTAVDGTALQAQGIARWTNNGWQAIANPGAGGHGKVNVMTVFQGKLIVGGDFTGIGGSSANNLAAYDPNTNTWSSVGGGVNGEVQALYVYDGELLVGGSFTRVGLAPNDQPIAFFARWDGTSWKAPDPRSPSYLLVGGNPLTFAEYNGKLYVGGNFTAAYANQSDKAYIAVWDKATQALLPAYPVGQAPDNSVWALAVWNNKLYIGGEFQTIGGVASPRLAALNGGTYEAVLGSPVPGQVQVLLPTDSALYVAGSFTSVGGQTVNRIARLSTSGTWSALGPGIGPLIVNALALHNGYLYAGGNFTQDGAGNALAYLAVFSVPAALSRATRLPLSVRYESTFLTLTANEAFQGTLTLANPLGQVLYTRPLRLEPHASETIDLSVWPVGFYLVSISTGGQPAFTMKVPRYP